MTNNLTYCDFLKYTSDVLFGIKDKHQMLECLMLMKRSYPDHYERMIDDLDYDFKIH